MPSGVGLYALYACDVGHHADDVWEKFLAFGQGMTASCSSSWATVMWHRYLAEVLLGPALPREALVPGDDCFLLLPGVRVNNLASHVLALATAGLGDEWEAAHGVRPLVAHSYVGPDRPGTCYRASGGKCCAARTSGSPPGRRAVAPRAVSVKPLAAGWRAALCREPGSRLGAMPTPHPMEDADWADIEDRRGGHPYGSVRDPVVKMGRA